MRQKVIADEKAQEYPVIHKSLKVECEWQLVSEIFEFEQQILPQNGYFDVLKLCCPCELCFVLSVRSAAFV